MQIFSASDFTDDLAINQERNFIRYLHELQQAVSKWPTKDEMSLKFTSQYVARGMGLSTGEQHRKTTFYIYSNGVAKKRSNILMYIRGPYGTRGKATIAPFHNLKTIPVVNILPDQDETNKKLGDTSFLRTISLDFTSLISSTEDKSAPDDIPIQIDMEINRAKVTYIPKNTGMYEINLISDGELLRGSPYSVCVTQNTSGTKESFSDEEQVETEKITFTKRKVLSKIIDCIDEQIFIDNGKVTHKEKNCENDEILKPEINCTLDKISEEKNSIDLPETEKLQPPVIEVDETDSKPVSDDFINEVHKELIDFIQPEETVFDKNLTDSTKNLKNILNTNRLVKSLQGDENNNNSNRSSPKKLTSRVYLEINPKTRFTSPICPHIAPEVDSSFKQLPVSEKRKIFSMQSISNFPDSSRNSTFSSLENDRESSNRRDLGVLSTSTVSLPEIRRNLDDKYKTTRDYWEKVSSCSSSEASLVYFGTSKRNKTKISGKFTKSMVDIVSIDDSTDHQSRRCKSVDDTLETSKFLTIEERKQILLRNLSENQTTVPKKPQKIIRKNIANTQIFHNQKTEELGPIFTPISDRIRKFDRKGAYFIFLFKYSF